MRSLSVPDHLGKFAHTIQEMEERLEHSQDEVKNQFTARDGNKPRTLSCYDLEKLQDEHQQQQWLVLETGVNANNNKNNNNNSNKQVDERSPPAFSSGSSFLPRYEAFEDAKEEELGLVVMDNNSVASLPSCVTNVKAATDARIQQQEARKVVEDLASVFSMDLSNANPSASPTTVMDAPHSMGALIQARKLDNQQGEREQRFQMLTRGDRSWSLPANGKPPTLKPSLKSGHGSFGDLKRTVSFGTLKTREFNICLSDHPSCSYGPPISLGWEYQDKEAVPVEDYETQRKPRRSMDQMVLSYNVRRYLLLKRAGYSRTELKEAMGEVERVKRERFITDLLLPTSAIDETVEDVIQKMKAMFAEPRVDDGKRTMAAQWSL